MTTSDDFATVREALDWSQSKHRIDAIDSLRRIEGTIDIERFTLKELMRSLNNSERKRAEIELERAEIERLHGMSNSIYNKERDALKTRLHFAEQVIEKEARTPCTHDDWGGSCVHDYSRAFLVKEDHSTPLQDKIDALLQDKQPSPAIPPFPGPKLRPRGGIGSGPSDLAQRSVDEENR